MPYLDHAATSPLCDEAREAMAPYLDERFGNASEPHRYGRAAREGLEQARETVSGLLGCRAAQVVFTSGGSEADNQAVFGLTGRPLGRLVVSAIEHAAVLAPARELERQGFDLAWAPVDGDGVVDVETFSATVRPLDRLAAVMWANNVTGAVQPVAELAAICGERGVPLHVDAVQAAASIAIDFAAIGAETMALSAHKMHGPKGVGALVARDPSRLRPLIWGGGQEGGLRSGTENVAGVVGFAAALAAMRTRGDRRRELRDRMEAALPDFPAVSRGVARLPGHSLLLVPGIRADVLVLALDRAGYAVAAGSACASGDSEPSHVLVAQGMSDGDARSVIRVSIGVDSTEPEVDGFCEALRACVEQQRAGALL
ncbi:MAG: cysteine desulfurase [Gaiellales bacterium]|jgi:cysteine desulfurase|nr:cysteine desulfurase [Gaiellales bacterium]MDX6544484.1 cysteine desulfurase [Gaiellales bacterium]